VSFKRQHRPLIGAGGDREDKRMTLTRHTGSVGTLIGVFAASMWAGCASPQAQVRDIDAQADPVLRKMCAALDGAKAFRFRVTATIDRRVETGRLAQFHRESDITVARPDRTQARTQTTACGRRGTAESC
jgi:hypothetical protein